VVGYFGIVGVPRALLSLTGLLIIIASGYWLGRALGDARPLSQDASAAPLSKARRAIGVGFVVSSVILISLGALLLTRPGRGNPMGPFLLADILWGAGMLVMTPWLRPGPRFVRDVWLVPAALAMGVLTIVGVVFPSDYSAALLFFLPQLATAAFASRNLSYSA
jgi:hypothetical protein